MTQRRRGDEVRALMSQWPEDSAGSVMRCYARAVRVASRLGATDDDLPVRARTLAEQWLRARHERHQAAHPTPWDR
jgi:hypothetical protein